MQDNSIEVYSTHIEGKSVVAGRFNRILNNKIYEHTYQNNKKCVNWYRLDYKVDKYNTYHRTIKMKPFDVKTSIYVDFDVENNYKSPKFKVVDQVRISKYKNIFNNRKKFWY